LEGKEGGRASKRFGGQGRQGYGLEVEVCAITFIPVNLEKSMAQVTRKEGERSLHYIVQKKGKRGSDA